MRKIIRPFLVLTLLFTIAGAAPADETPQSGNYVGRPLVEVLNEMRQGGALNLIYSSDVVTSDLIVKAEPKAKAPQKLLRELLAQHGLTTQSGPGGTILVVRDAKRTSDAVSSIRGAVRDAATGTPLAGARIEILEIGTEVETGADGSFEIASVRVGAYTLKARIPGYVVQQMDNVRVVASRPTQLVFRLLPSPDVVAAVVVTPSAYRLYGDSPETRQSLSREEIEQTPNLADDINRVVARLPGIANPDISAKLYVRGGADNEVLVLVDGMELYAPFHFEPHLSMFSITNSRAVDNVDVFTGAFSAQYGDRMSGVLDISSASPTKGQQHNLGVSFLNAHYIGEGTFEQGRGEWLAAVRRGYMDVILNIVDDHNTDVDPTYGDVMAKVRYALTDRTSVSGRILYAANQIHILDFDGTPGNIEDLRGKQSNSYAWATLENAWNPKLFSRTMLYAGRLSRRGSGVDVERYEQSATIDDDRTVALAGIKQDWTIRPSDRHMVKLGFDARSLEGDYDYYSYSEVDDPIFVGSGPPVTEEIEAVLENKGWDYGVYASDRIKLGRPLTVELGLRWDRQTYIDDEDQVSPRFNLLFEPTQQDSFRAAWGRFNQSQGIHELQVQDGIHDYWSAQETQSTVLGYERAFGGGLSAGIEAYTKTITSPWPRSENLFANLDGISEAGSDRILIEPEEGRADGVELFTRSRGKGPVRWWLGYVWSRAEDKINGEWVPRSWDQTHALTVSFNHRIGQRWNFNASGIYHTGWPTTQVTAELVEQPDGSFVIVSEIGPRNRERYDDFYRLDVRASKFVPLRRGSLTFFVEVINLFASDNPCCGDDFDFHVQTDGSVRVNRYVDSWMPRIPSFGVDWRF
jgi:hypothetical protein